MTKRPIITQADIEKAADAINAAPCECVNCAAMAALNAVAADIVARNRDREDIFITGRPVELHVSLDPPQAEGGEA